MVSEVCETRRQTCEMNFHMTRKAEDEHSATRRKPTLSDVAAAAGVSIGTASKALHNQSRISLATRKRVQEAAERLSYMVSTPDLSVSDSGESLLNSMLSDIPHTIGIITDDLQGRFSTPLIIGAERRMGQKRILVLLCNAHGNPVLESDHIDMLLAHGVKGIILLGFDTNPRAKLDRKLPIPVVYAYAPSLDPLDCSVTCDNVGAGHVAVQHLMGGGRDSIAVIGGSKSYKATTDRVHGIIEELGKNGLEVAGMVRYGEWSEAWGRRATELLLVDGISFDAVICGNDQLARGCIDVLKSHGLRIPQDVAVMGHDNWEVLVTASRPPLTSIDNRLERIGELTAQLLVDAIEGNPHQGVTYIPCRLYPRASTVG